MGTLRKVYFGKEGTRGTAVPADTQFLCEHPSVAPDRRPTFVEEAAGVRARSVRSYIPQLLVNNTLRFPHLYFQALPMLFEIGVKGNITPVEQTGGEGDYLWAFGPSYTASNAPDSITLEMGDDTQAYEVEYVMAQSYRFSGTIPQDLGESPVSLEVNYFGRQNTATSFTGAISIPTVEPVIAKLCRFYLDATWANVGTTEKTSLIRAWDLELITGVHPQLHGGANKFFDVHGEGLFAAMLTLTMTKNASSDAIFDLFMTDPQALAVARIEVEGAQIGAGDNHKLSLDISGHWEIDEPNQSTDRGVSISTATIRDIYDGTGAKNFDVNVTTDVSAT